jgi:hypothetical protein
MSLIRTNTVRRSHDHFEPEVSDDPQVQRRVRAQIEQMDYTAFAANREAVGHDLGVLDPAQVQRLAIAAAHARANWVSKALAISENATLPSPNLIDDLAHARSAFEELSSAYEGVRRMVERGYITFTPLAPK